MRVTNKMLSNNFMSDMNNNLNAMQKLQQQLTSGKEIRRPSDDPFKVARIMQLSSDIDANKQYNENISDTINFLDTTDTALGQAGNVLQRVRELLVSAGNGSYSQQERNAIKNEINAKIGELSQVLNTNFDGKYIFGGNRGDVKPVGTVTNATASNGAVVNIKAGPPVTPGNAVATVSGTFTGTADTLFKVTVGAAPNKIDVSKSTDGGVTYSALSPAVPDGTPNGTSYDFDFGNGLKLNIPTPTAPNPANQPGDTFTFASTAANTSNNTKLIYNSNNPAAPELAVNASGTNLGNAEINKIDSKLTVEISQGVYLEYNVTASDILQFNNGTADCDVRQILSKIVNHLDGKNDDGTAVDPTAVTKLTKEDLTAVTDSINNLLKLRSEVGAKQNRMDSAKDRNDEESFNMTEMLSKTEDIDITKKTMEMATAQTIYMASLQTSAKIIQPSLLDYLR